MDPVHDRGSMDPVHESGPWTRSKEGVHGPLVHVLSSPISCSFDFLSMKFQIFCVVWAIWLLTLNISSETPVHHCNISWIMYLVRSKPVRYKGYNSYMFFCKNDVMFRALWRHLLSLPCQFSIFEDLRGWNIKRASKAILIQSRLIQKPNN